MDSLETRSGVVDQQRLVTTALREVPPLRHTERIRSTGRVLEVRLVAGETVVELAPGVRARAWAFNRQVPGPEIRATEGDLVRITVENRLPEPTSVHWHGLHVPVEMDGVVAVTQKGIAPGESFTYEFLANHAGTFMYHSHLH